MRAPRRIGLLAAPLTALFACGGEDYDAARSQDDDLYVARDVVWKTREIPVCFEELREDEADARAWVEDAARSTWDAASGVDFVGFGACAPEGRGLRVRFEDTGPYTDGLGSHLDGKPGGVVLNATFATWSTDCQQTREHCVRVGAVHELGHALGFAHEQNRPDTPGWCTSEQGLRGDLSIGPWDLDSVMNYCNPVWTGDGRLSRMDVLAVQAVYGRTPGAWSAARSLVEAGPGGSASLSFGDDRVLVDGGATTTATNLTETDPLAPLSDDVDGDGRADAVAYVAGRWWLAIAGKGTALEPALSGFGDGAHTALLGDVDGDRKADAVVHDPGTGAWHVARSTGAAFDAPVMAAAAHGAGRRALLADVDGDGRADAVTHDPTTGAWHVARSTGAAFGAAEPWLTALGREEEVLLGDVDGDGRADAVSIRVADGQWTVARSTGTSFDTPIVYVTGHGVGGAVRLLADVDGDGRADAVVFSRHGGDWWVARSTGASFGPYVHARGELGLTIRDGMVTPLLADVDGDGRADALLLWH